MRYIILLLTCLFFCNCNDPYSPKKNGIRYLECRVYDGDNFYFFKDNQAYDGYAWITYYNEYDITFIYFIENGYLSNIVGYFDESYLKRDSKDDGFLSEIADYLDESNLNEYIKRHPKFVEFTFKKNPLDNNNYLYYNAYFYNPDRTSITQDKAKFLYPKKYEMAKSIIKDFHNKLIDAKKKQLRK